jgi:hypothetical protein
MKNKNLVEIKVKWKYYKTCPTGTMMRCKITSAN